MQTGTDARLKRRLIGNSIWNVSAYLFYVSLTFVSLPLFLRYLGKAHYGVLVLLGSLTAPLGLLNLGFGQATVKFVADRVAHKDLSGAARFVSNTLLCNLATGGLGAAILVLLAPMLAMRLFSLTSEERPLVEACLRWTALAWVSSQAAAAFIAVPTALQRFELAAIGTMLLGSLNLILSMVPLLLGYGLLAVVKVRFLWSLVGVLGWICIARHLVPQIRLRPAYEARAFRHSFGFGVWQAAATVGGLLANQSDKYLLGIYLSAEAVGIFNVPYLIFSTIFTTVSKLSESIFPAVSDLEGRAEARRAVEVLLRTGAWLSMLMVCLQGTIYVFARDILQLYVGPEISEPGTQVLRIFALTAVIAAPSVVVNQYLLGTGATVWLAVIAAASGILTLLLSCVLIPRFGLAGAAWSDLGAILFSRPLSHWAIWRYRLSDKVRGAPFVAALYRATVAGVPVTLVLSWAKDQAMWPMNWPGLIIGSALTLALFVGLLLAADRWLPGRQRCSNDVVELAQQLGSWLRHQKHSYD